MPYRQLLRDLRARGLNDVVSSGLQTIGTLFPWLFSLDKISVYAAVTGQAIPATTMAHCTAASITDMQYAHDSTATRPFVLKWLHFTETYFGCSGNLGLMLEHSVMTELTSASLWALVNFSELPASSKMTPSTKFPTKWILANWPAIVTWLLISRGRLAASFIRFLEVLYWACARMLMIKIMTSW